MKRRTEHEEIWGDIPHIPDELSQRGPESTGEGSGEEKLPSFYPHEALGEVPRIPKELQEASELKEAGAPEQAVRDVGVVETLARLRTALEEKIGNENLPSDEWWPACQELLAQHPEAQPYEEIFKHSLLVSEEAYESVNRAWLNAHVFADRFRLLPVKEGHYPTRVGALADEKTARRLFYDAFGKKPRANVTAEKGLTAIYFTLGSADLKRARKGEESVGFARTYAGLPYIVAVQGSRSLEAILDTITHEKEHVRNKILHEARKATLLSFHSGKSELPGDIGERLDAWTKKSSAMEERAKDELLASSAGADVAEELSARAVQEGREPYFDKGLFFAQLQEGMTSSDGFYRRSYEKEFKPSTETLERYIVSVNKAIGAYRQLYERYQVAAPEVSAGRMTRNVLEQFPLHRWPAAVRLLEMHHREKELSV